MKKYIVLSFLLLSMNSYGQCLDMGGQVINLDRITLIENHCESEGAIKFATSILVDDPSFTLTMNEDCSALYQIVLDFIDSDDTYINPLN